MKKISKHFLISLEQKLKTISIIFGIIAALSLFIIFGVVTAVLPNAWFTRMAPTQYYDYIFLFLTSILSGVYIGLWYYTKNASQICNYAAAGGTLGGIFSFGCAICNKLLVLILGIGGVTAYFMPFQPILGVFSVIMLAYAVYRMAILLE